MRIFSTFRALSQRRPLVTGALTVPCGVAGAWAFADQRKQPSQVFDNKREGQQFANPFVGWSPVWVAGATSAIAVTCKLLTGSTPIQCETIADKSAATSKRDGAAKSEDWEKWLSTQANKSEVVEKKEFPNTGFWPIISLEEVKKHVSPDSIWVTHEGGVYDVTKFVPDHPGGMDLLLSCAGLDMAPFWDCYKVHGRSDYARDFLESYKIGELSPADAQAARNDWDGQHEKSIVRGKEIARRRWWPVVAVMMVMPYLFLLRKLVQILGLVLPSAASWVASFLPISVPGYGHGSARCGPTVGPDGRKLRVAVIGGGIAGCSCAWALEESGFDAEVYEARAKIGGNARVVEWSVNGSDGKKMRTDATVLFICPEFYKNYVALLERIGANFKDFWMPFIVHSTMDGQSEFFTCNAAPGHVDLTPNMRDRFAADLAVWDRCVKVLRVFENLTTWDTRPSYYKQGGWLAMFNPFNFVTAHSVCRVAGMSEKCWTELIEPLHSLNLSQVAIANMPAVVMPLLDQTAPINHTRKGVSWGIGNSEQVFTKITEKIKVRTWTRVLGIDEKDSGQLLVRDDQGGEELFDRVVMACPASACANILKPAGWLEETLMRAVRYEDDEHRDFMQAIVHEDPNVLPKTERKALLRDSCFLLDIAPDPDTGRPCAEITHNMGTWPPALEACGGTLDKDGVLLPGPDHAENPPTMLVSHCLHKGKTIDESKVVLRHDYGRSHPSLKMQNLIITSLVPLVQGRRGVYYATNWLCPGNGHDLSCIAGMSAATSIGAEYPFPENELAKLDFERFRSMLGLDDNQRIPWFTGFGVLAAVAGACSKM